MMNEAQQKAFDLAMRLKESRGQWLSLFEELARMYLPNRAGFTGEVSDADERSFDIYTSAPRLARRGLATALSTMLRPPGREWFKAKASDELLNYDEQCRVWLDTATKITYAALYDPEVDADRALSEADDDLVTFGTAVIQVLWDWAKSKLKIKTIPLKHIALMTNAGGKIDGIVFFMTYTLREILDLFPEDKLPASMKEKLSQGDPKYDEPFEIVHVVMPNDDYLRFGKGANRLPYKSLWFSSKDKELIDEGGYISFPYIVPRWDTMTGESFGRSPGMVALADSRLSNAISKTLIEAGEKALDPPLTAPADMIRGDVELFAGGLTLYDAVGFQYQGDVIKPINLGKIPDKMFEFLGQVDQRIYAAFYRDVLELPNTAEKDITATEINARMDQYLRQAAPVFSRIESQYNAPLIDRVFELLANAGMFPDAPEALQGSEIRFEYESPVKQARDKAKAIKMLEGLNYVLPMAQVKPEIIDNVDMDITTRLILRNCDFPQEALAPLEAMQQIRAQRAKQAEMAQMAQMAQMAGPSLAQGITAAAKAKEAGLVPGNENFPQGVAGLIPPPGEAQNIVDADFEEAA